MFDNKYIMGSVLNSTDRTTITRIPDIPSAAKGSGIDKKEQEALSELKKVWSQKLQGNLVKLSYYNSHVRCKNIGLAFKDDKVASLVSPVIGWPSKSVDMLAERSQLDYFSLKNESDFSDLREAYDANNIDQIYRQATTSELVQSCCAITVTLGDKKNGDPDVVVNAYPATNCALVWDQRHKRIKYGLTVTEIDDNKNVTSMNLFMDDRVVSYQVKNGGWYSKRSIHSMGRPLIEPLVYRPSLDRPFGKSRITRAVRSITDNALREILRTEVSAEVFTAPQRYFLNASSNAMDGEGFRTYWNNYLLIPVDEDGNSVSAGQFTPPGMNDHIVYMRSLAAQFSGETALPISSLGVVSDNPSSAEAIYAAKEDLVHEADYLNSCNSPHIMNVARLIVATARDITFEESTKELEGAFPYFRRTDMPSRAAVADLALKEVQAIPELAQTKTFMRQLFPDDAELSMVISEMNRTRASDLIKNLANGMPKINHPEFGDIKTSEDGTNTEDTVSDGPLDSEITNGS